MNQNEANLENLPGAIGQVLDSNDFLDDAKKLIRQYERSGFDAYNYEGVWLERQPELTARLKLACAWQKLRMEWKYSKPIGGSENMERRWESLGWRKRRNFERIAQRQLDARSEADPLELPFYARRGKRVWNIDSYDRQDAHQLAAKGKWVTLFDAGLRYTHQTYERITWPRYDWHKVEDFNRVWGSYWTTKNSLTDGKAAEKIVGSKAQWNVLVQLARGNRQTPAMGTVKALTRKGFCQRNSRGPSDLELTAAGKLLMRDEVKAADLREAKRGLEQKRSDRRRELLTEWVTAEVHDAIGADAVSRIEVHRAYGDQVTVTVDLDDRGWNTFRCGLTLQKNSTDERATYVGLIGEFHYGSGTRTGDTLTELINDATNAQKLIETFNDRWVTIEI